MWVGLAMPPPSMPYFAYIIYLQNYLTRQSAGTLMSLLVHRLQRVGAEEG